MVEVILKEESYKIVGACFEVYNTIGCGFLEAVYQECLGIEFSNQAISYKAQVHNYLKATGFKLGLLMNFGQHPKLQYERIVN